MTFKAYVQNIQAKSGKTPEDFYRIACEKGLVKVNKIVASHNSFWNGLKATSD